jgi:hypothetical protein
MAKARDPLTRIRDIIGQWPETSEKLSHGAPTWWGGRKTFATVHDDHHGDGRLALWIKSTHEAQADLVAMDPKTFFVPAYVGPSGWIGMRLDRRPKWDVVEELLLEGYRTVAPKRALKQLDEA